MMIPGEFHCMLLLLLTAVKALLLTWRVSNPLIQAVTNTAIYLRPSHGELMQVDLSIDTKEATKWICSYEDAHIPGTKVENISISNYIDFLLYRACLASVLSAVPLHERGPFSQHVALHQSDRCVSLVCGMVNNLLSGQALKPAQTALPYRPLALISTIYSPSSSKYSSFNLFKSAAKNSLMNYIPSALHSVLASVRNLQLVLVGELQCNVMTEHISHATAIEIWSDRLPLFLLNKALEVNPHLLTSPLSPLSLAVQQMTPLPPWYRGAELVGLLLRRLADEGWERCDSRYASSSSAAPCPELEGVRREMRRGTEALRKAMLELIEREVMQTIRQQEEMHEKAKEEWREVLLSDERATSEGTSQQPFYP